MASAAGHLFVVHADLTKLSCDGVLIPCDGRQAISRWWFDLFETEPAGEGPWEPLPVGAALKVGAGPRTFGIVDTVSVVDDLDRLIEVVTTALAELAASSLKAHQGRDLPLIAMPLPGTGNGNFAHRRGAVVRALVPVLADAARRSGVDIALVMRDQRDYAAVQSTREHSGGLTVALLAEADRLGRLAGAGQLAVFVGAGASVPLGLPDWESLVNRLRSQAGLASLAGNVSDTDLKQAASEAARTLGEDYAARVEQQVHIEHHALSHGLLASLQSAQSVTTNFDVALEMAMAATHGQGLKVIRKDWATSDAPWLLKLHGTAGDPRGVVLTKEEYEEHEVKGAPLYGMIQSLLMTSHLLFIGFSLTDSAYLKLAQRVADVYRESDNQRDKVATAVGLTSLANSDHALDDAFHHVHFTRGDGDTSEAARLLEVFLDRVAWTAAKTRGAAHEYLLDRRYDDLVEAQGASAVRDTLESLDRQVRGSSGPVQRRLLQTLLQFGATP